MEKLLFEIGTEEIYACHSGTIKGFDRKEND